MQVVAFLERSRATPAFRDGVAEFLRTGRPNEAVNFDGWSPPVKVERALCKALEAFADLPLERIRLDAISGCESYAGTAQIEAGAERRRIRFAWDCRWRAEQMGWTDWFGFPDQARAAREFGYDCFREWQEEPSAAPAAGTNLPDQAE